MSQTARNTKPMTSNEVVSREQQLGFVLGQIKTRRDEVAALLPPDVPFETFHASINQALRSNPDVLDCHGPSIVNACVKAAYDGLRIDGREAAISVDNVKYQRNPDRFRKEARYMPMAFGLRKQIMQSGLMQDVYTVVVYEKEPFELIGGLNRDILHKPLPDTERGPKMKAVYSVAVFLTGYRTFEVMWRADVELVKAAAKTKYVWDGPFEPEMWRKSVLRRHRKSLPSTRDIRDSEAEEMFPQFDASAPHPQLAPPPRPRRTDAPAALNAPAEHFGNGLDPGGSSDDPDERDERVTIDQQPQAEEKPHRAQTKKPDADEAATNEVTDLPHGTNEWTLWGLELEDRIAAARDVDACNAMWVEARPYLDQAAAEIASRINQQFTDRIADLATEGPTDAATGTGDRKAEETK